MKTSAGRTLGSFPVSVRQQLARLNLSLEQRLQLSLAYLKNSTVDSIRLSKVSAKLSGKSLSTRLTCLPTSELTALLRSGWGIGEPSWSLLWQTPTSLPQETSESPLLPRSLRLIGK